MIAPSSEFGPGRRALAAAGAGARWTRLLAVLVPVIAVALAFSASASAARSYESQLTGTPSTAPISEEFGVLKGLAIDPNDDLWAAVESVGTFDKFATDRFAYGDAFLAQSPEHSPWYGGYLGSLGREITWDDAASLLFAPDGYNHRIFGLNSDATPAGIELLEAPGAEFFDGGTNGELYIAADNSSGPARGDLYINSTGENVVYRVDGSAAAENRTVPAPFSASAPYIEGAKLTGTPAGAFADHQTGFAVDPSGNLFVALPTAVYEFKPSGEYVRSITEAEGEPLKAIAAVAVDPTDGNLLVAESTSATSPPTAPAGIVDEFSPTGAFLREIAGVDTPAESLGEIKSLALSSSGHLFVSEITRKVTGRHSVIDAFSPFASAPKFTLNLETTGGGTVTSFPKGIACGASCAREFEQGTVVKLTTHVDIGETVNWTGCDAVLHTTECRVEVSEDTSVKAEFVPDPSHVFSSDISGAGATALSGPTEVAVDQASHDVYVNDPGNYRVEKFSPNGAFVLMIGAEVNKTATETPGRAAEDNVCPAPGHPGDTCQSGSPGPGPGQFENPAILAVDNSGGPSNGDLYVADRGDSLVQKFAPNGQIVSGWGVAGQKDGSDAVRNNGPHFYAITGIYVNSAGELGVQVGNGEAFVFAQNGNFIREVGAAPREFISGALNGLKVDGAGNFYGLANSLEAQSAGDEDVVEENLDSHEERSFPVGRVTSVVGTTGFAFDSSDHSLYQDVKSFEGNGRAPEYVPHSAGIEHYSPTCDAHQGVCEPIDSFGAGHLFGAAGVSVDSSSSTVYVANSATNDVAVFTDNRPTVITGPPLSLSETSAVVSGTVDPASHGVFHEPITHCRLEYGLTGAYGNSVPCEPDPQSGSFSSSTPITATLTGLTPISQLPNGARYHYRFVAFNDSGSTGVGADRTLRTTAPPKIEGTSSSHVTATSADLEASVDPHGLPTKYSFEYGTSIEYGQTVSGEITGSPQELSEAHSLKAHIEGLQPGATYHFRVLAENESDEGHPAVSEDQTFEFFPPSCPNSAVRQQTGAVYLPDCRAYELVSPANASATLFYPGGPNTGQSTSPARFAYTGAFSAPPGVNPINTSGDLYVATRTSTGWVSHYVGLPGDQAGCMGGIPTDGRNVQAGDPRQITNGVLTDPSMSKFLNYVDGSSIACVQGRYIFEDQDGSVAPPSMAPFLWGADGSLESRLPSGIGANPAALQALQCPYRKEGAANMGSCTGETTASGDLSHLVFSSAALSFSAAGEPPGLTAAPGSAYEEDLATGQLTLISRLPAALGEGPIPQDPGYANVPRSGSGDTAYQGGNEEFIRFPAVSEDGSHVLMSTASGRVPIQCGAFSEKTACLRYVENPLHLYMRVQHGASGETYEIAENPTTHEPTAITFVGATPDGSEVYFTSTEHLTHEDEGHGGASLYLWSADKAENGEDPLTLVSKGPSETAGSPGDTASCSPSISPFRANPFAEREDAIYEGPYRGFTHPKPWTTSCGVVPYSGYRYSWLSGGLGGSGFEGRSGGSGFTPAGIAANGDIYFYSPEKLDGVHGAPNQENLFLYRGGHLQYVTTLEPEHRCGPHPQADRSACSDGPIVRLQTTPDDSEMGFITASQVTPYDNNGHLEMYTYTPSSGEIHCASCNPDGQPASADVFGSEDGLFLTNDGRVFFSTTESLTPRDTNEGEDVYEYVEGRPQLITPGTGTAELGATGITGSEGHTETDPGLVGVSANGTDVYFSTIDTLLSEDHNGNFLRFYDARTNGGFAQPTPPQPCAAAEECHGPGTEAPQLPARGTTASLGGGNVHRAGNSKKRHRKRHHRKAAAKRRGARQQRSSAR